MRRAAPFLPLLVLSFAPCLAQDGAAPDGEAPAGPQPLRVAVDLQSNVEGAAESVNTFQYYVWSTLHQFGIRADSKRPIGEARYDRYIDAQTGKWAERAPDAPPATLVIDGRASADYDNSEFFGQGQAHNYSGNLHVEVKDAATGESLAVFDFDHSWGRLPANYTRSQVLREYNDMLFTTLILGVLSLDRIQDGVPEAKQEKLARFIEEQRTRILEPLAENMSECEIAVYLRSLADDAEEGGE